MNILTTVYKRCEIVLESTKQYDNPFLGVDIDATFTHTDGTVIKIPGFWNGKNQWKVRFSSEKEGVWQYEVVCSDKENASLFDNGTIAVEPCLNPKTELEKHGYIRLEEGKKHFVYNDGTPFFYLADTHWMMPDFERLDQCNYPGCSCGNQFKHLADDRIKKGFNVYQTYFWGSRIAKTGAGTEGWWTDDTYTKINPDAFNKTMDIMIEYLANNGVTVALGFGTHHSTVRMYNYNIEPMKAFARYCVARYACYPLIWITGQEVNDFDIESYKCWMPVGATVKECDGFNRPNGAHMHAVPYETDQIQNLGNQPWHQWWTVQAGHGGYDKLQSRYYYKGYYFDKKMFVETESQYEDVYCNGFCGHDASRLSAWQALQSGSGGFTYGVTGIWVFSWDQKKEPAMVNYSPDSWDSGMDRPGSDQVGYMKKFYDYVKWYELEPSFDHKYGNFDDRNHIAISHKGDDVFVYYFFTKTADTGYFTSLCPNTKYQARLFDTIVGKFIDIDDVVTDEKGNASIPAFPAPRDWVLLLNKKEINFGPYESYTYPNIHPLIATKDAIIDKELEIKSIKVSSFDDEHPAKNMLDNNPETYWQGYKKHTSQTITVDLGDVLHFDYVHFECINTLRPVQFRIFASKDGENFDLLTERFTGLVIGDRFGKYFDATSGDYRYIRVFFNSDKTQEIPLKLSKFAIYTKK